MASQDELIKQFLNEVGSVDSLKFAFPDMLDEEIAKLFIISRKYNLKRAVQLFKDHVNMRENESLNNINPLEKGVHRELVSGKFTILNSINNNSSLAIFTESCRSSNWSNYKDAIKALIFQLDVAVRSESLLQNGLNVIYNMSESSYNKFDFDFCARILKLLKGKYPAPLKFIWVLSAPIWFRAPYNVLKLFVSEKMRKRIFITDPNGLKLHLSNEDIPVIFGGSKLIDHQMWLKHCFKVQKIDNLIPYNYFSNPPQLMKPNEMSLKCRLTRRSSLQNYTNLTSNTNSTVWYSNTLQSQTRNIDRRISDPQVNKPEESNFTIQDDLNCSIDKLSVFQQSMFGLNLRDFEEFMHNLPSYDVLTREYVLEFSSTKIDKKNHFFFSLPKNKSKNRYMDVVCLDHKRVDLPDNAYIHANFVDSYLQKNAYICSQGPLESTVRDFFQMIFYAKVPIVVMTTGILEGKTKKCANYLPSNEDQSVIYGEFKVSVKESKFCVTYKVSEVELYNNKANIQHKFFHYHFLKWPDYGIPESPKDFIGFIEVVHNHYSRLLNDLYNYESELETYYMTEGKPPPPPILVHCSAGIGRTGTFVTIAINHKRAKYEGKVNIKDTLKILRTQRSGSIQMPQQYVFCFLAILYYIENFSS